MSLGQLLDRLLASYLAHLAVVVGLTLIAVFSVLFSVASSFAAIVAFILPVVGWLFGSAYGKRQPQQSV